MTEPRAQFELGVEQAQAIVDAVEKVRGVDSLSGGQFGEVSLFFPKKRIEGIRRPSPRDDSHIEIHVVADVSAGFPLAEIGDAVREAAQRACSELTRVDVEISDVSGSFRNGSGFGSVR